MHTRTKNYYQEIIMAAMNRDDNLITVTYRPINTCKRKNIEDAVASSDGAGAHRHSSVEMFL